MINNWNDLTLDQYCKISALDPEDSDWIFKVAAITENKTIDEILTLPLAEAAKINAENLNWIKKRPKQKQVKKTYWINGKKYRLQALPNEITTAQYIDFCNADKEVPACYAPLLAIFMIPEGKKYNEGYDLQDVTEDVKQMPVEDALSVCDFFRLAWLVLSKTVMKKAEKALRAARKEGVDENLIQEAEKTIKDFQDTSGWK